MACAPSEDSNQPGHSPSLIIVFTVRMKKHWVLSYPLSAQQRLRSAWASPKSDQRLCMKKHLIRLGTHVILLVLSCAGSDVRCTKWSCNSSPSQPVMVFQIQMMIKTKFVLNLNGTILHRPFKLSHPVSWYIVWRRNWKRNKTAKTSVKTFKLIMSFLYNRLCKRVINWICPKTNFTSEGRTTLINGR